MLNDHNLSIKTSSLLETVSSSIHHNRYEATPYEGLEALSEAYSLKGRMGLVDYGCGKGRVSFYFHHLFGLNVTGVEMNPRLYQAAMENQAAYLAKRKLKKGSIQFEHAYAEKYEVQADQDVFYFFNPFSVQLFTAVINLISVSLEKYPRNATIILYYPTVEYIHQLEENTGFELVEQVPVPGLVENNHNERFLIFEYSV
ncbi:class I SAM-dependent methyltransferase [Jeotgalibacillus salarius]|uniref:Class I SAM-dependent methyltransferase n=1 Tax=Jeotgalibacillus salarius TaxID=546023 RepID=A0A4Y8LLR3_9BACL|nr:class I SAM-dependent methyltransferase [Jeotgalibacillus salarius]TFE01665.1 class I SAM-dependent methyltransferase [Jeotgalibacillus salarius]